jgi:hypothetical protein
MFDPLEWNIINIIPLKTHGFNGFNRSIDHGFPH